MGYFKQVNDSCVQLKANLFTGVDYFNLSSEQIRLGLYVNMSLTYRLRS